ncbi:MAG: hypothetical protein WD709_02975, partial [Gammaproteobacteria bacterium]
VYNKIDATGNIDARVEQYQDIPPKVWLSAHSGEGTALLRGLIGDFVRPLKKTYKLHVPAGSGKLRANLFERGTVNEDMLDDSGGWVMQIDIEPSSLERICRENHQDLSMLQENALRDVVPLGDSYH